MQQNYNDTSNIYNWTERYLRDQCSLHVVKHTIAKAVPGNTAELAKLMYTVMAITQITVTKA